MSDDVKKNITRIGDYPIQPGQKASDFTVTQPDIEGLSAPRKPGETDDDWVARRRQYFENKRANQFIILSPSGETIDLGGKTFDDYEEADRWVKKYFPNQPDTTIVKYKQKIQDEALRKLKNKMNGEQVEFTREEIKTLNDYGDLDMVMPPTKSPKEKDADSLERLIKGQGTEADSLKQYKDFPQFTPGSVTKLHKEGLASLKKEEKVALNELKKIKDSISKKSIYKNKIAVYRELNKTEAFDDIGDVTYSTYFGDADRSEIESLFDSYKDKFNEIKSIKKRIKDHRESK